MTPTTDKETMLQHCQKWNMEYLFTDTNNPFLLILNHGKLFSSEHSTELEPDEKQLLKKAVKRIGKYGEMDWQLAWQVPVQIFFYENSPKLKLYHGLVYDRNTDISIERTWFTINDKLISIANSINGIIPQNQIYYGIEIPREIVKNTMAHSGFRILVEYPDIFSKPNTSTIFIKSINDIEAHYNQ